MNMQPNRFPDVSNMQICQTVPTEIIVKPQDNHTCL